MTNASVTLTAKAGLMKEHCYRRGQYPLPRRGRLLKESSPHKGGTTAMHGDKHLRSRTCPDGILTQSTLSQQKGELEEVVQEKSRQEEGWGRVEWDAYEEDIIYTHTTHIHTQAKI